MLEAISPDGWKRGRGYSHAIRAGGRIAVAGVLPWDPTTREIPESDFAGQWARALANLAELLGSVGVGTDRVISLRVYVTDLDAYEAAGAALADGWSAAFGRHFPAITLVEVSRLVEPGALVEIEAEALDGETA
jgi:enamine deaminase RidA (YjgF/YER057c/UK114 family)